MLARRQPQLPIGVLLLIALTLYAGCEERTDPAPASGPNVLLLTVDTLRADRLGAWGYELPTSPNIDRLASESVVFLEARAPSPWTLPSLASLMTSTPSSAHQIWRFDARLPESFDTLAELLDSRGYRTAAIGNHTFLGEKFGLHQGFQEFDTSLVVEQLESHLAVTSPQVSAKGIAWLRAHGKEAQPWLLWLHYFDPHAVYQEHAGLSERFGRDSESQLYDGEIAFTDRWIGEVLRALDQLALQQDTLVVLVADHGEEFQEHGFKGHGRNLHREVLHVPLLFRVPGIAPRRVEGLVTVLDVLPTLLELLGLPAGGANLAGHSLVGLMRGEESDVPAAVLGEVRLHGRWESLETADWKLIRSRATGKLRLYDLRDDPGEQQDVAERHPEQVALLEAELRERVRAAEHRSAAYQPALALELEAAEIRRLKELGYIDESADPAGGRE